MLLSHPGFYAVVAEKDGKVVGSNFLDERGPITGVGPTTVDPAAQNGTIGRQLMQAVLDRASERQAAGVRLLQSAFHNRSLCLYTRLGFDTRETVSKMEGLPLGLTFPGYDVRPAVAADIAACNDLCERVHGHPRSSDLEDAIKARTARVVEHHGEITGLRQGYRVFRPYRRRQQPWPEGADRGSHRLLRRLLPAADPQQRTVPLVPAKRLPPRASDDLDDNRSLQRAARRLSAVGALLGRDWRL
jgi:hypothetical protein